MVPGVLPWGVSPRNGQRRSQRFDWSGAAHCPQRCAWLREGNRAVPAVPSVPSVPSPRAQTLLVAGDPIPSERGCPGDAMLSGWQCGPQPSRDVGAGGGGWTGTHRDMETWRWHPASKGGCRITPPHPPTQCFAEIWGLFRQRYAGGAAGKGCAGGMWGARRGCGALGGGAVRERGHEERERDGQGKGRGRQQHPEAADARPGARLEGRACCGHPSTSTATGGDPGHPGMASGGERAGAGARAGGQRGSGGTLLPTSASNLADPRPGPHSSLICLSSKAVKLIRSPTKSPGSNPSSGRRVWQGHSGHGAPRRHHGGAGTRS